MLILSINELEPIPVYRQIVDGIRSEIASGRLKAGEGLPSVRELALHLRVNVNTVHKAYQILNRMGVVIIRQARGVIVAPQIKKVLGSVANEVVLAGHVSSLLREAARLGFDQKTVIRMIQQSDLKKL